MAGSVPLLPLEVPRAPDKASGASTGAVTGLPYLTWVLLLCAGVCMQEYAWGQVTAVQICATTICPLENVCPCMCTLRGMYPMWLEGSVHYAVKALRSSCVPLLPRLIKISSLPVSAYMSAVH